MLHSIHRISNDCCPYYIHAQHCIQRRQYLQDTMFNTLCLVEAGHDNSVRATDTMFLLDLTLMYNITNTENI